MHELQSRYVPQIRELADAANRLAAPGFVTSQGGNLSLRAGEAILITPTRMAGADIFVCD